MVNVPVGAAAVPPHVHTVPAGGGPGFVASAGAPQPATATTAVSAANARGQTLAFISSPLDLQALVSDSFYTISLIKVKPHQCRTASPGRSSWVRGLCPIGGPSSMR